MRVAVDTNILLDVLGANPTHGARSREALRKQFNRGALIACDIVWAEVAANFPTADACGTQLHRLGIAFDPLQAATAAHAGQLWRAYRRRHRGERPRILADFLIGAHAADQADALLTRDAGFYRQYFTGVRVVAPGD